MELTVLRTLAGVRSRIAALSLLILLLGAGTAGAPAEQPPALKGSATAGHTHRRTRANARAASRRPPRNGRRESGRRGGSRLASTPHSPRSLPPRPRKTPPRHDDDSMVRTRTAVRHQGWTASRRAVRPADPVPAVRDGTEGGRESAPRAPRGAAGSDSAGAGEVVPGGAAGPGPARGALAPEAPAAMDGYPAATTASAPASGAPAATAGLGAVARVPPALPEAANPFPGGSGIVAEAPMRGSLDSLVRQNLKTEADNLERIENDEDLHDRIGQGSLVALPVTGALSVDPRLDPDRRYCRPWTARFLTDLSRAHDAQFHHPLVVNSAVRTVDYQKKLMRTNGNAAAAEGDVVSPHVTGAAVDIAKQGLTRAEIYWLRDRLSRLQSEGRIDVEEEFHQACFHITVYKSYVGDGPPHRPVSPAPPAGDEATPPAPVDPSDS